MFCENCGNQIPDSASFCDKCGAKVNKVLPYTQPVLQTKTANADILPAVLLVVINAAVVITAFMFRNIISLIAYSRFSNGFRLYFSANVLNIVLTLLFTSIGVGVNILIIMLRKKEISKIGKQDVIVFAVFFAASSLLGWIISSIITRMVASVGSSMLAGYYTGTSILSVVSYGGLLNWILLAVFILYRTKANLAGMIVSIAVASFSIILALLTLIVPTVLVRIFSNGGHQEIYAVAIRYSRLAVLARMLQTSALILGAIVYGNEKATFKGGCVANAIYIGGGFVLSLISCGFAYLDARFGLSVVSCLSMVEWSKMLCAVAGTGILLLITLKNAKEKT